MRAVSVGEEENNRLERTVQMLGQKYSYFDINERMLITPLSKQLFTVIGFCRCFEANEEIETLKLLYKDPISFVLKNYDTNFSEKKKIEISIKKTLGQLEWIFYRDSHRFTSLKREYSIDARKPKVTKRILFEDITAIRGYVEMEINKTFIKVVKKNNVNLEPFNLPVIEGTNDLNMLMEGGK